MPYGWHFTGKKLRDGSKLPRVGEWEVFTGPLRMCESGLHVGRTPWDALQYAPGENLRYVEYAEVGEEQSDKIVCARRKTIAQMDATEMLRYFARKQALSVVHLWNAPDIVLDYLMTGDDNIRAAAWDAASTATWGAASAAGWAAANAAAESAAEAAASAWDCGRRYTSAGVEFNALVYECFENVIQK